MIYYRRFCGDYMRDTGHLSLSEHGAYTVLLDHYYSAERALPDDRDSLYRLCRATTAAEKKAVRSVVDQFFVKDEGGLVNRRAQLELEESRERISQAVEAGKQGAKARWGNGRRGSGSHGGSHGGRHSGEGSDRHSDRHSDPTEKHSGQHGGEDGPPTPTPTPDHSPEVSSQPERESARSKRALRKCPASWRLGQNLLDWLAQQSFAKALDIEVETAKFRDHTFSRAIVDWDGAWRNWMRRAAEFAASRAGNGQRRKTRYEEVMEANALTEEEEEEMRAAGL